jgi:hypothetical protein
MRCGLILSLLIAITCWSQTTTTGKAETSGICSPAVTGNKNTFAITCGIDKKQGQKMLEILNKILANQLDPNAVMRKLEEIITNQNREAEAIGQIQQLSWRKLTDEEIDSAASLLAPFAGTKVRIIVTNSDGDRLAVAQQLATILRKAQWDFGGINTPMGFFNPAKDIPHGIQLHVREATPAAQALGSILVSLFGRPNIPDGLLDDTFRKDEVEINIWYKAR